MFKTRQKLLQRLSDDYINDKRDRKLKVDFERRDTDELVTNGIGQLHQVIEERNLYLLS